MSAIVDMNSFRHNVTPVDPAHQARLDFALKLMAGTLNIDGLDDLEQYSKTLMELRDALEDHANDIAFAMRMRGTSDWDVKKHLQNTCPLLAAMYRAEAIAADRIECDTTAWAKLAAIRDLMVQGIEERMPDREYDNVVYPSRDRPVSSKKRWAKIAEKMKGD